ncbi:MAG: hypothetical protein J6I46_01605 [Ruminococcus sp.]|nr:hypothetical protein [Ruminococcus sp.]
MGLMDAFGAECRVEITVRELIATLDEKAKAEAGFNVAMDMLREGVAPETVRAVFGFKPKEKEPTPAEAETSSKGNYTNNDTTKSAESQALRGVEVIGLMQTMLLGIEESFGYNVDITSLRADSEQAHLMFRYGGTDYVLSFGLAF